MNHCDTYLTKNKSISKET